MEREGHREGDVYCIRETAFIRNIYQLPTTCMVLKTLGNLEFIIESFSCERLERSMT